GHHLPQRPDRPARLQAVRHHPPELPPHLLLHPPVEVQQLRRRQGRHHVRRRLVQPPPAVREQVLPRAERPRPVLVRRRGQRRQHLPQPLPAEAHLPQVLGG